MAVEVVALGECMIELFEQSDSLLSRGFGGDTLNTAVYLARLGISVRYATALGDDPFSDQMIAAWAAEGVRTELVARVPGCLPGLYMIQTDSKGERSFHYWRDKAPVRALFTSAEAGPQAVVAALSAPDVLYLSGISLSLFGDEGRERLYALLAKRRAAGRQTVFDSNFRPRGWPDRALARQTFERLFALTDIAFISTEDWALLYESPAEVEVIVARLGALGVNEMVIRRDPPSCLVVTAGARADVPARTVETVVDTTAAGDSFAAAYLAARLTGAEPARAAAAGHELAAIVIQHRGAVIPASAMANLMKR